jgi:serine/threonine-protein kinase
MEPIAQLNSALTGRYEIDREIGAGGMATVYLARDLKHDRNVALKVLKPELGAVLGVERFLSEIKVTANLQHPNLLPLFDSGEARPERSEGPPLLFYVMPYVEGESLRARLEREKQLPVDDAVKIAVAVASALAYAHERGVIHRDLKPENILLQAGQPVIADFGIALAVSKAGGARVTQTGLSLGTPQYMSPEQAAGDRAIDGRSDIYSLGAVTYEMLAGEPPHSGTSAQAIIAKLMSAEPQPLRALRATVPVNVACAVEKALAKLPADRFSSATDFAAALTNPMFTLSTTPTAAGWNATERGFRRLFYGATALAALFLAAALWGWLRPAPTRLVVRYNLVLDSAEALTPSAAWGRIALSPDGSRLAYIGGPHAQVMVRSRNQLYATPLPGTEEASTPFFSPDGEHVGFVTGRFLKIASLNGGPPITVTDSLVGAAGASWGPDGFIYADGLGQVSLVRVAARAGAVPKWFTVLDTAGGEGDHIYPDALPGGKGVLFTVTYRNEQRTERQYAIAVADIASGKHRVLVRDAFFARYVPTGHLLYVTSTGTLMVVRFDRKTWKVTGEPTALSEGLRVGSVSSLDLAVSAAGTLAYSTGLGAEREPVWVTRDGKAQPVDSAFQGAFSSPAISPDGKQLAITMTTGDGSNIWIKQLDRGPRVKLTFEGPLNDYPAWTPDGRSVTYFSNASGPRDLWTKRADGSAQAVLQLHEKRNVLEGLWSPDGKWLVFRTGPGTPGAGDILAIRPGTDTVSVPLVATNFSEFTPALSPDGRWLAYSSNENGPREVYVVPFPNSGTAKWAVSTHGGTEPLWSHRGGELFYRDGAGFLVAVEVKTASTFSMGRSTALFPAAGFTSLPAHQQYAVSPDDRRFLMLRPLGASGGGKLVVVENWFEELKATARVPR